MTKRVVKTQINGVDLTIETGRAARQAGGSVWVQYGETVVLATATGSAKPKEGQSFFPLTVDYNEKMYAAGRIPGNFFKREARPSTDQILISRMIDRPIRPLFPEGYLNDVHVTVNVLSYDGVHHPESIGTLAASAALSISQIPFQGPVASIIAGLVDGEVVINPTPAQLETSSLRLSLSGTKDAITMVEAGADLISEAEMLEALIKGHEAIKPLIAVQEELIKQIAPVKWDVNIVEIPEDFTKAIKSEFSAKMNRALKVDGKLEKYEAIDKVQEDILAFTESFVKDEEQLAEYKGYAKALFHEIENDEFRSMIVNDKQRTDGRALTEIRPITVEVDVLPRTHGSALFTRGETQSLGTVTLGAGRDEVLVDGLDEAYKKRFFLHYNFPSFSVGEVGGRPGPGRREIGHGALAERALAPVMPDTESFPYVVRIVSDILESNGSSSMASVCSGSLSLMQAGVPIKEAVAGIAMGLVSNEDDYVILTDIAGLEDHMGDMDFKVAGSRSGITALQMDIKILGVSADLLKNALEQARVARLEILDKMNAVLPEVSLDLSEYAPRIEVMKIDEDKVGELIGPGGKNIKKIIEKTGVTIDIEDGGIVNIYSENKAAIEAAKAEISAQVMPPEIGAKYEGTIKKVMNFGLFVEYLPGREGLLHVSKIGEGFIKNLEDKYKPGDPMDVMIQEIDNKGRVNLTRP